MRFNITPKSNDNHHQIESILFLGIGLLILLVISLMPFMENGNDHILKLTSIGAIALLLSGIARFLQNSPYQGFIMAFIATLSAVGAYFQLMGFFRHTEFVFILSVIGITSRWGLKPGLFASILAAIGNGLIVLFYEQNAISFEVITTGGISFVAASIIGTLTHQREAAIQTHSKLTETLNQSYAETIRSLVAAIDKRDSETGGHSERVTVFALSIAHQMHLDETQIRQIHWGSFLHDIGKIGIPDHILRKREPLTDEEWKIMRTHPQLGYEMLKNIPFLQPAMDIILYHHEHFDGSGYPKGLAGEDIPVSARIFSIADAFDAMINDRPYRMAMSLDEAVAEIERCSNSQFDPQIIAAFKSAFRMGWEDNPHYRINNSKIISS